MKFLKWPCVPCPRSRWRRWRPTACTAADIDLFIPHQANRRILEATAKRIGMSEEQVFVNVERYGNTSGAIDSDCS